VCQPPCDEASVNQRGIVMLLSRDAVRWLLILVIAAVLIALIGYARGDKHHRGDDVGALRASVVTLATRGVSA
jgi:hypothetical protein